MDAFERLDNKAKDILSGSRKVLCNQHGLYLYEQRQLTDWWLRKIEISTDQFLCKRNFDFEAVPNNYILQSQGGFVVFELILLPYIRAT